MGLLEAFKKHLAMLDRLMSRLRLNALKMLEPTRKSERESNEVHRCCPAGDKLLSDKVDLNKTFADTIDQGLGIMQITTDSFTANFRLGR